MKIDDIQTLEKENQATLCFNVIKNGITLSYNYTFRTDNLESLQTKIAWAEGRVPQTKPFPDDDNPEFATPHSKTVQPVNLGKCSDCGALNKLSKMGNEYCSALCWKKNNV